MDKIAIAGLVVGIIGGLAGIVGAVAAVYAAKYAKGSATQTGLDAVAENTAKTTEEIATVREHIAQVDSHLRMQNNRHELGVAGASCAISVTGEGWADNVLALNLTLVSNEFSIEQIELTNEGNLFTGAVPCKRIDQHNYVSTIAPALFSNWYSNGKYQEQGENRTVSIRAVLMRENAKTPKTFAVTATMAFRYRNHGQSYFNSVRGQG